MNSTVSSHADVCTRAHTCSAVIIRLSKTITSPSGIPMLLTVIQWLPSLCGICTNSPHTTLNWCIGTSNEDCSPLILPCLYHSAPSAALLSCHLATCCLASSSLSLLLLTGHFHNVCSSQIVHIVIWLCSTHESCMYLEEHLVKSEIRGEFDSHQ